MNAINIPTFAGLPNELHELNNSCVARGTIRMFPWLDPQVVAHEFRDLNGEEAGMDPQEILQFLTRLGVDDYLDSIIQNRRLSDCPTIRGMTLRARDAGEPFLALTRDHLTYISPSGEVWDSEEVAPQSRVPLALAISDDRRQEYYQRFRSWAVRYISNVLNAEREIHDEDIRAAEASISESPTRQRRAALQQEISLANACLRDCDLDENFLTDASGGGLF